MTAHCWTPRQSRRTFDAHKPRTTNRMAIVIFASEARYVVAVAVYAAASVVVVLVVAIVSYF